MLYLKRCIQAIHLKQRSSNLKYKTELDNHADTFVAGHKCLLLHYTERVCDVIPYSDDYEAKNGVPVVQVATGYTNINGESFILLLNEVLRLPHLENSLLNSNQLREFGIEVQDNPYIGSPIKIDNNDGFVACLQSKETNIFINTKTSTARDLNEYAHVVLTSFNEWNPSKVQFTRVIEGNMEEIETMGVTKTKINHERENEADTLEYYDPYLVQFKSSIYKSLMQETRNQ